MNRLNLNRRIGEYLKLKTRMMRHLYGDSIMDVGEYLGIPRERIKSVNLFGILNKGVTPRSIYYKGLLSYIGESDESIRDKMSFVTIEKKTFGPYRKETMTERLKMARALREARTDLGLGVGDIADMLEVECSIVQNWEIRGISIRSRYFRDVVELLGIEPDDIYIKKTQGGK